MTVKFIEATPAVLSLGKFCEDHDSGPMVRSQVSPKNGVRISCNTENYVPTVVPVLSTASFSSSSSASPNPAPQESEGSRPIPVSIDSGRADQPERGNLDRDPAKNSKTKKNEGLAHERVTSSYSEILGWLLEFWDNLVDESVLEPHGARVPVFSVSHASSSHEPSREPNKTKKR